MATKILSTEERLELYERMRKTIVCICEKITGSNLIGGGVFLEVGSKQLVLTAAHVVAKKRNLHIVSYDNKSYDVQVSHLDQKRDVALLDILHKPNNGFECARLCENDELIRNSEIHFIGHPGRQIFTYNVGNVSCVEKTCGNIYRVTGLKTIPKLKKDDLIDDFRELDDSVKLVQAKNVHGGGRFGGTGAPFLDGDGNIVGLYSFTFGDEDNAVHVVDVNASISGFKHKGKGKKKKTRNN